MGVEQAPAAGRGRRDRRQAGAEDRAHRARERERDRPVGSQLALRQRARRAPALADGPGTSSAEWARASAPRHAAQRRPRRFPPARCAVRRHADVHRPRARANAASAPDRAHAARPSAPACRTARRRLARVELEPPVTRRAARRAHDEPDRRGAADEPPRPARAATVTSTVSFSPTRSCVPGHSLPCRTSTGILLPSGRRTTTLRDMSRVAGLDDVGQRLGIRLDLRVGPPEQRRSGRERACREQEADDPEGRPDGRLLRRLRLTGSSVTRPA